MFIPDQFSMNDLVEIRRIVHDHGWATLVTAGQTALPEEMRRVKRGARETPA